MAKPSTASKAPASPEEPVPLDLLVVGASAAGSSAAFAVAHAGLKVAVYTSDPILAEAASLPLDAPSQPESAWPFGEAGQLLRSLTQNPDPNAWRAGYGQFQVSLESGQTLAQLSRLGPGLYHAVFQSADGASRVVVARQVLLTSARGHGDAAAASKQLEGVADRLDAFAPGPHDPICVIGGGAEALGVIAELAHHYQGQPLLFCDAAPRLPAIPEDLRDVFFHLMVETGNLRFFPKSQLVGLVNQGRGQAVSIRLDAANHGDLVFARHLELSPSQCLIVAERPFPREILQELGASLEQRNHQTLAVVDEGFGVLPGIYLAGTLLSPGYVLRTYSGETREEKHHASLGQAIVEGMTVAHQVIHELGVKPALAARGEAATTARRAKAAKPAASAERVSEPPPATPVAATDDAGASRKKLRVGLSGEGHKTVFAAAAEARPLLAPDALRLEKKLRLDRSSGSAANAQAILAAIAARNQSALAQTAAIDCLLFRLRADGSRIESVVLHQQSFVLGKPGEGAFTRDADFEGIRAKILRRSDGYVLRDEGSAKGIFLKLDPRRARTVARGDLLRLGDQYLVCDQDGKGLFVRHYDSNGNEGRVYYIQEEVLLLGRANLAPEDELLAQRHLALYLAGDQIQVRDLGSAQGSYLRLIREFAMTHGDVFELGQETVAFVHPHLDGADAPVQATLEGGEARVTVVGMGGPYVAPGGLSLCEIADRNGLKLNAECRQGACGLDAVRIVSGKENVDPQIDDLERDTLERICGLKPGSHRLACKLRIHGPVRLRLIEPDKS